MIFVIALIVCGTAVSLLFMQEIINIFNKIVSTPGVVLVAPLLMASWLVESYHDWLVWIGWVCQDEIRNMLERIATFFMFPVFGLHVIKIVSLYLFAFIPFIIIWGMERYKGRYALPRIASYISIVTWVIALFLIK